jgi:hypothetical protein
MTLPVRRVARPLAARSQPLLAALAAASLMASVPAARGAESPALVQPAAQAGDHARYHVLECDLRVNDRMPAASRARPPSCKDSDVDIQVLRAGADGSVRERWTFSGATREAVSSDRLEYIPELVKQALAHGVPVDLDIDAAGKPVALADAAALRAGLKRHVDSLATGQERLQPQAVQRLGQKVAAISDAELLFYVHHEAMRLHSARGVQLVPGATTDGVTTLESPSTPFRQEADHHTTVSALTEGGHDVQVTLTDAIQGERSKAMIEKAADAARGMKKMTARDEQELREMELSPPSIRATYVSALDLRTAWPVSVKFDLDMKNPHETEHHETTYTRL